MRAHIGRKWRAVVISFANSVGGSALGVRNKSLRLCFLISCLDEFAQLRIRYLFCLSLLVKDANRLPATVSNGSSLTNIAEFVHLQRERVLNAWVNWVAFVVVTDRFTRMNEEYGVTVVACRLQSIYSEVLIGDDVGVRFPIAAVQGIDLQAQHRAFKVSISFAFRIGGQAVRQNRVIEQERTRLLIRQPQLAVIVALVLGIEKAPKEIGDVIASQIDASVEPGLSPHGGH